MMNSNKPGKVVVAGLDGATFDLIKPWAAEGHLPVLQRILTDGAHGTLNSTVPPMTAPAWTSFATGCNPGQHGLYDWIAREANSYRFTPVTALDSSVPPLYTLLSGYGRKVVALNVPMTYPPVPVNGVMVSGMPTPSTDVKFTYPEDAYQDILNAIGEYILYPDPGEAYSDSGIDSFLERLYRSADLRMQAFTYLRKREDPDFAMMVFNGTDTISHALWKYMDSSHPLYDPAKAHKYGHAIRDYYKHVDTLLACVVQSLDENTTLIIMSDHGFGPFHKFIHVNNWLIQQGFMTIKSDLRSRVKRTTFEMGFSPMNVYNTLMKLGFGKLKREVVRGQGQGLLKTLFLSFVDVDWSRTLAYSLGNVGQVYLNVAGREPQGIVQPGEEYEQVRKQIIERLERLRDPDTGERVVGTIYRREEIYHGDQLEHAADIVFIPTRLEYFGFGEYEFGSHQIIEAMQRGISGTHRMNGIFLAYGAAIKGGVEIEKASLIDLAPTILHLMSAPIPEQMDGQVLEEIITPDFVSGSISSNDHWSHSDHDNGSGLSDEQKKIVADRLRGLGYVG
ncbi:MAG: alkaline phosphatase family protein [Candidatus Promineifilaceae bacterium]|nr:alkaline phosphatase family protein [Candidatus Promineifilaceae bacterium]